MFGRVDEDVCSSPGRSALFMIMHERDNKHSQCVAKIFLASSCNAVGGLDEVRTGDVERRVIGRTGI